MKKIILYVVLVFNSMCVFSSEIITQACSGEQRGSATISSSLQINFFACIRDGEISEIEITTLANGRVRDVRWLKIDGAYSLNFDTKLDLNDDGVGDLSVANGMGRSGEGRYYFIVDIKNYKPIYLGDFLDLIPNRRRRGTFYSAMSGVGDIQSTRIDYKYEAHHLRCN